MRYRDEHKKFSGANDQALHEYIAGYQQVSRDYTLTATQQLQFMHNMFTGEAKRFYDEQVEGFAVSFSEAVHRLQTEYNSPVRQNAVKTELASLRVSNFVAAGQSEQTALANVYTVITKLAPQLSPSHRGDAHKIDFLRGAVIGMEWALGPMGRIAADALSFQHLYNQLIASLQLYEETRVANAKDGPMLERAAASNAPLPILFAGQGMYGRPNKGVGASTPRASTGGGTKKGVRFDPLTVQGCFNCEDPTHTMRKCPRPINAVKAAQRKLAYYAKKNAGGHTGATTVLYELCIQLDAPVVEEADGLDASGALAGGDNAADLERFEELLLSDVPWATDSDDAGRSGTGQDGSSTDTAPARTAGFALGE